MSGYREHSYDPNAYERQGRPLRPFNWVQWLGVALALAGAAGYIAYFASEAGLMPRFIDTPTFGVAFTLAGVALINSRRQTVTDPAPELAPARKRWLIIVTATCFLIFGIAAAIQFTGA